MVKNLCKNSDKKTQRMNKQIKYSTKIKNSIKIKDSLRKSKAKKENDTPQILKNNKNK